MDTPPAEQSITFFAKIGYELSPYCLRGEGVSVWRLTQPNSQGSTDFVTLEEVWNHWASRGDMHIRDNRMFCHLCSAYEKASEEEQSTIREAVRDYVKNTSFFCAPESGRLVRSLAMVGGSIPARYSASWLETIVEIVNQPHGGYGFSARAGIALGVIKAPLAP
jgi:hypothetical protein